MYHNLESAFVNPLWTLAVAYRLSDMDWSPRDRVPVKRKLRALVHKLDLEPQQTLVERYETFRIGEDSSVSEIARGIMRAVAKGLNVTVRLTGHQDTGKAGGLTTCMFSPFDCAQKMATTLLDLNPRLGQLSLVEMIARRPSFLDHATGMRWGGGFRIGLGALQTSSISDTPNCLQLSIEGCLNDASLRDTRDESVPVCRFEMSLPLTSCRNLAQQDEEATSNNVFERVLRGYIDTHYEQVVRGLLYAGVTTLFEPNAAQIEGIWSVQVRDGAKRAFAYAIDLEGGWTLAQASEGQYRRVLGRGDLPRVGEVYGVTEGVLGGHVARRVCDEYAALVFRESVVGV